MMKVPIYNPDTDGEVFCTIQNDNTICKRSSTTIKQLWKYKVKTSENKLIVQPNTQKVKIRKQQQMNSFFGVPCSKCS